jgi:protein subunit release factor A
MSEWMSVWMSVCMSASAWIMAKDMYLWSVSDGFTCVCVCVCVCRGSAEGDDLAAMAREEADELLDELRVIEPSIVKNIMPRDSADSLNVVLEVRAGTGGEEASLFASELFRMYEVFCQSRGWRWELLTQSRTDIGGFTAAQANVSGG